MPTLLSMRDVTFLRGSANFDPSGNRAQKIYHLVFVDRIADPDTFDIIAFWTGLPAQNEVYASGDPRIAKTRDVATLNQTATEFLVTINYEVPTTSTFEPNPLDRPDEISGGGERYQEPYFLDEAATPKQVSNILGELFQRMPLRGTSGIGITITGNRSSLPLSSWVVYLRPHSQNSGPFIVRGITIGEGEAKMVDLQFSRVIENTYRYWRVQWMLECAPNWIDRIPNRGLNAIDEITGDYGPIWQGKPPEKVTEPWPIDEDGFAMANSDDEPPLLEFQPCPSRDFSIFGWTATA